MHLEDRVYIRADLHGRGRLIRMIGSVKINAKPVQKPVCSDFPFASIEEYRDVETLNLYQKLKKEGIKEETILRKLLYGSRDHARTPMQWSDETNAGFSCAEPWIKVNPNYREVNVAGEETDKSFHYMIKALEDPLNRSEQTETSLCTEEAMKKKNS